MFAAIYSFKVKDGKEEDFIKSWRDLTEFIYQYENSFGSRLHKSSDDTYIAYALWPDKNTWENVGNNLPESSINLRQIMKESCLEIKTVYEMEVVDDYLKQQQFR